MNSKISYAVAAILGRRRRYRVPHADDQGPTQPYQPPRPAGASSDTALAESHRHRAAPFREHAGRADLDAGLTAQTLQQLNISTFDDYIKYLPNVTTASNGPGQSEVFMRGLSAGSQPSQGSGSTGLWPNVAIYLDNQSGQLPNRNLDIYAADLNRIEVLEGPQGTLFGSGAEAGVIRYITNEPKLDVTEGSVKRRLWHHRPRGPRTAT
jgi:iron complex outermembrane receptor protein